MVYGASLLLRQVLAILWGEEDEEPPTLDLHVPAVRAVVGHVETADAARPTQGELVEPGEEVHKVQVEDGRKHADPLGGQVLKSSLHLPPMPRLHARRGQLPPVLLQ